MYSECNVYMMFMIKKLLYFPTAAKNNQSLQQQQYIYKLPNMILMMLLVVEQYREIICSNLHFLFFHICYQFLYALLLASVVST